MIGGKHEDACKSVFRNLWRSSNPRLHFNDLAKTQSHWFAITLSGHSDCPGSWSHCLCLCKKMSHNLLILKPGRRMLWMKRVTPESYRCGSHGYSSHWLTALFGYCRSWRSSPARPTVPLRTWPILGTLPISAGGSSPCSAPSPLPTPSSWTGATGRGSSPVLPLS